MPDRWDAPGPLQLPGTGPDGAPVEPASAETPRPRPGDDRTWSHPDPFRAPQPAGDWPMPTPTQPQSPDSAWDALAATPPPPTNPWAVVSLATAVIGLVPVALVTGFVARSQIRRRNEAGAGLAIAGIVVAACLGVLGVLVLATAVLVGFGSAGDLLGEDPEPVSPVAALRVGDCFDTTDDAATTVDCTEAHEGEVYVVDDLTDFDDTEREDAVWTADGRCWEEFEDYVGRGYMTSDFDFTTYAPDEAEWAAGERRTVCALVPLGPERTLDGSARDSGR